MRMLERLVMEQVDALQGSEAYGKYILENNVGERLITNGDALNDAMEAGYLFEEFLESIGMEY